MRAFVAALSLWLVLAVAGNALASGHSARALSDGHVGTSKTELVAQLHHSNAVIARVTAPKVRWKLALRHSTCWAHVAWPKTCNHARSRLLGHRWLASLAKHRLAVLYPNRKLIPLTSDWVTAVYQIQRVFPGSANWLLSCSNGEGGHGGWVWLGRTLTPKYGPETTPGGWLQYMQRTFWGDYANAVADARARGFVVPAGSASYTSATGVALAGGWAYSHARPAGKWTGGGC